ncbi:MAG: arylsulfatase [Verrucomicrobia bacterium]|nr:arylsulfatase [Verrucomicrobiota bacterium]
MPRFQNLLLHSLLAFLCALGGSTTSAAPKPNIVFILADDLGYGDLGCYGQKIIQTPHLDRMAAEGMRFTQFYAGSTVCAPSRSVLMTGLHLGHTRVRGNASPEDSGAQKLYPGDVTVAKVLHQAGYATALVGKWGLGMPGDEGVPNQHGFDYFFGFLSQHHAHNHYPDFLWRNDTKVPLPNECVPVGTAGGGYATKKVKYAGDFFFEEAHQFVEQNKAKPFFLYLALTVPHANNERSKELGDGQEVPDYGLYADRDWHSSLKGQAAMVTRMDKGIGDLLGKLRQLGLAENTLVIFTSDNGPHKEGGPNYNPDFFDANGPLTGLKRSLTDGGIRVPFIAWWPGKVKAGAVSSHVGYFGDMMATFARLASTKAPGALDSISILPTLLGRGEQAKHDYLYWEFYEGGVSQAVLLEGRWKGIRLKSTSAPVQLFDLTNDIAEQTDLAAKHPELVARIASIMQTARVDNEHWKLANAPAKKAKQK